MQIYVHRNNQQIGPLTEAELKAQLASGALSLQDHAWWSGQAMWIPLAQSPFAKTSFPAVPPSDGPTSVLAIASMASNLFCGIGSVAAIVLGHMSLHAIKKNPHLRGKGFAMAGLAFGYAIVAICLIQGTLLISVYVLRSEVGKNLNSAMQNDDDSDSTTNAPPNSDTNNLPVITP